MIGRQSFDVEWDFFVDFIDVFNALVLAEFKKLFENSRKCACILICSVVVKIGELEKL